jgi:hypothetical protein
MTCNCESWLWFSHLCCFGNNDLFQQATTVSEQAAARQALAALHPVSRLLAPYCASYTMTMLVISSARRKTTGERVNGR